MYQDLVTSDTVMNSLIKEQKHVADTEEKLEFTNVKLSDFINQCNGFKSSLANHETNLKQLKAQVNATNRSLEEKESIVNQLNESTKVLVKKLAEVRGQVKAGEANLNKILKAQTDAFIMLENVDDEKVELEQKQEEQKKLILEAPSQDSAGFFEKIKRRRHASLLQGELDKLTNQIQEKQVKEQEANAKIEQLKKSRKEQNEAIQKDRLLIANMEKTIQENGAILLTHSAEVERLRTQAQEVSLRYRIVNDKVTNLREQILEKQRDIDTCSKAVVELQHTLAQRQASVIEKKKTHEEVSDEVTVGIADEDSV